MTFKIDEILGFLDRSGITCEYRGDKDASITGFCSLNKVKKNSITWIKHIESFDLSTLPTDYNLAVVTGLFDSLQTNGLNFIIVSNPKEAFFSILNHFFKAKDEQGISPTAIVKTDRLGKNVRIGHNSFLCEDVTVGDNVVIGNNVSIECRCEIGSNTQISSGTVIGNSGFGYYKSGGCYSQVPHFGGVSIGSDVTIGANTVIDRGTLDDTVIGDNTKIDGHVFIGHNVIIGKRCLIICGSQLCGSSEIGDDSYIAPHSVIMNQVKVGKHCMVGMGTVLGASLPDGYVANGNPVKTRKVDYELLLQVSSGWKK